MSARWAWEGNCCRCKVAMAMDRETYTAMRQSSHEWQCIYGHKQHFAAGKSEAEKLREQLEAERRNRQRAEQNIAYYQDKAQKERNRANGYKGHATKMTRRAKAGVCPCCNRTFKQLARHMASQHPTFTPIEIEEGEPA